MKLSVADIAAAVNAMPGVRADATAGRTVVTGVRTDSRETSPGDLFVPLIAERDGHEFIDAAINRGAVAWLTSRADDRPGAIRVDDTTAGLQRLARHARSLMDGWSTTVIGVTGSSGKTSTKDLIRGVLAEHGPYGASEKSFNNEIGAPLTLLNAPDQSWAVVVEMGARGIGHIASLCELARPQIGVVTNVGTAHLAMYDDGVAGIVRAKGELVQSLPSTGTAVLWAADPSMPLHAAMTTARVLTFGFSGSAAPDHSTVTPEVVAEDVVLDEFLRSRFVLRSPWGSAPVQLEARGAHQVLNALAAAAATLSAGASLEEVVTGLATPMLSPWRMEIGRGASGSIVINDAYNANDASMAAALRSLADIPGRRKIAVLGTMAELGEHASDAHGGIVELARSLGIDVIVAVNEPLYVGADHLAGSPDDVMALLASLQVGSGDVILVKGSRVAGLERLAHALTAAVDHDDDAAAPQSAAGAITASGSFIDAKEQR